MTQNPKVSAALYRQFATYDLLHSVSAVLQQYRRVTC